MSSGKDNKQAVAIKYDGSKHTAPVVVASGKGHMAEQIIKAAREAGVEISENADLAEMLNKIPVGGEIPVELYQAVAEVLAFVYRLNNKRR